MEWTKRSRRSATNRHRNRRGLNSQTSQFVRVVVSEWVDEIREMPIREEG